MESTIHFLCPGCGATALVRETPGSYGCAACGLDYVALARDKERFDAALVANMRTGLDGVLMALALHQLAGGLPPAQSAEHVRALAERSGIDIPEYQRPTNIFQTVLCLLVPSLGIKKRTSRRS
ncbi:MAG: DUF2732 domain-containing protein [Candidatus Edwardsbacteria bacterium]|nr:DUF2732 domain-containing protein [Candidatus Edwardsbacteria bacterium]